MKDYLVGFSIAVIAAIALYFFYIVPEKAKTQKEIDQAYYQGYEDCYLGIDTVFLPSDPEVIYRDTTIYVEKPAEVIKQNDSIYYTAASIDTALFSGKDTLDIQATVGMEINVNEVISGMLLPITEWFVNIKHKDFVQMPDTIKIKVPKLVEITKTETNWLYIIISFIIGLGLPFII